MSQNKSNLNDWSRHTKRVTIRLAGWTGAWVVTVALAAFGPEFIWENDLLTLLAIALNVGIGIGMIVSNIRHLSVLDEMMQKIQLEAMGLSLGAGVVGGIGYSLLDATNLISSDAEIGHLIILMAVAYLISLFVNLRRYR